MSRYENGVSFWDTRYLAEELARSNGCFISFQLDLPMRRVDWIAWQVRVVARWYDEKGKQELELGESAPWPNPDAKTFAGLELLLLVRLERKIADHVYDVARQLPIPEGRF